MSNMRELVDLAKPLIQADGFNQTRINRVRLFRTSQPILRQPIFYDSWIVANLQGSKTLHYADRTLRYDRDSILCVTSGSPVECEADASPAKPLIALVIDLRMDELMGMAARMSIAPKVDAPPKRRSRKQADAKPPRVVDVFPFSGELREVYGRLLRALHDPSDALMLGESLVAEVVYRVLQHGLANSLAALVSSRNASAVLQAIRVIHGSYADKITIDELAPGLGMSPSAFHLHFRKITSYSPLQYIKNVRLSKAREAIRSGGVSIQQAASRVGYESASQFSREYKRYFGCAPSDDLPKRGA